MSDAAVIDAPSEARFRLGEEPEVAELTYRLVGDRLILVHTGVPDAMAGQGVGGRLVAAAVHAAAARGLTVVPRCPFARAWLRRNPDVARQAVVDWEEEPRG